MRTIGFVLVLLGIVIIYLATQGKIGAALSAFITGKAPDNQNSDNANVQLPQRPTDPASGGNYT